VSFSGYPTADVGGRGGFDVGGHASGHAGNAHGGAALGDAGGLGGTSSIGLAGTGTVAGQSNNGGESGQPPDNKLIDDFEDGDARILPRQDRSGSWYGYNDGLGSQTPPPDNVLPVAVQDRGESKRGLHFQGSGFTSWGTFIGFDLKVGADSKASVYPSAFTGVSFWARIEANSRTSVRLAITTSSTVSGCNGCACALCNDHFAKEVGLSTSWRQYFVAFADTKQDGWGNPQLGKLDVSKIVGVRFQYKESKDAFNLWIDDVAFY
jgi:hypothetical protein